MTRSLYSILNVSPDADPAVIEAAYKALMKKFHPDMLVGEPETTQRKAAEINQAFQVLRDPERRAEYDSREQARQSAMWIASTTDVRPMPFQQIPPPRRSKWPALLLIAVLTGLVVYVWQMTEGTERERFASSIPAVANAAASADGGEAGMDLPPISPVNIDRAIAESRRINQKMGLMGLSGYSQDCFASQSRSASAAELDFCVAFDSAALTYDTAASRTYSLPELPRFQAREMMSRHLSAAKLVADDDAWVLDRLTRIRSMTAERLDAMRTPPTIQAANIVSAPAPRAVRTAARPVRRATPSRTQPQRGQRQRRTDAEFMERQGYIY